MSIITRIQWKMGSPSIAIKRCVVGWPQKSTAQLLPLLLLCSGHHTIPQSTVSCQWEVDNSSISFSASVCATANNELLMTLPSVYSTESQRAGSVPDEIGTCTKITISYYDSFDGLKNLLYKAFIWFLRKFSKNPPGIAFGKSATDTFEK